MIGTVFKISVLRLWNNKQEMLLLVAVPILFFSIFAMIFSRGVGQASTNISLSIVNDDPTQFTTSVAKGVLRQSEVKAVTGIGQTTQDWPIDRLSKTIISQYAADIVVYFPANFAASLNTSSPHKIRLLNEGTNPVSARIVEALIKQSIASEAAPRNPAVGVSLASTVSPTSTVSLVSTGSQVSTGHTPLSTLKPQQIDFEEENIFAVNKHQPKIAMYAAGIAVMFLLFSASGAGGSLLEEREAGTLGRLLISRLTITQLLLGKWVYITALGFTQITVMFIWGQMVFDVDLVNHLQGFCLMALATSCACASFALCLASVCRSRNQLNGISLVLVLSMSALGGSMIPRYIMSDSMQRLGRFTFNGWALDGFKKIFWYDLPVSAIRQEIIVLLVIAALLGTLARLFAQKWSFA